MRSSEARCPFCGEAPELVELRPVRSRASVRVAIAAALAGATAALPSQAGSLDALDHARTRSDEGYSRWSIAQGGARYGVAPSPNDRTLVRATVVDVRVVRGTVRPDAFRAAVLRGGPRFQYCAERVAMLIGPRRLHGARLAFSVMIPAGATRATTARATVTTTLHAAVGAVRELTDCNERVLRTLVFPEGQEPIELAFNVRYTVGG